ncbi:MAG: flagellar biosynthesis protein FlhA [Acidobacteriota bacterium]
MNRLALPLGVILILVVMVIPMPTPLMDLLISADITISLVVLLAALAVSTPVQFSVFPTTLLLLTVFRLALNIASTRLILLNGQMGESAAGQVIAAFGQFVVGGNLAVGLVVFLILLAVQFIVINHGATRISEVTARFTLDAMPGKQMAIDADLNAGIIDEGEARRRRQAVSDEAEFYGSMDGAVRFTQRDAIAAILITAVNIIAGLIVGVSQGGMSIADAARTYSLLTVGDGLVTTIPALLISVAGGVITTRSAVGEDLGLEMIRQVFGRPMPLRIGAAVLASFALVPGMPKVSFLIMAAAAFIAGQAAARRQESMEATGDGPSHGTGTAATGDAAETPDPSKDVEALLAVDPLTLEVGYGLVSMVNEKGSSGSVLDKIQGIRRQVAGELGFIVPPVRVRDNLRLPSDGYTILLRGNEIGSFTIPPGRVLAIDPGHTTAKIEGVPTREPAFGLDALWVATEQADAARAAGYTVVDAPSLIGTHLLELVRRHAAELLTREDTSKLLDHIQESAPKVVEELVPERLSVGAVQRVLTSLLAEKVSIRDLQTILETLADVAMHTQDHEVLSEACRQALCRSLTAPLLGPDGALQVITFEPALERRLEEAVTPSASGERVVALEPREAHGLLARIAESVGSLTESVAQPILMCSAAVRGPLRRLASAALPSMVFLSPRELPPGVRVKSVGRVA